MSQAVGFYDRFGGGSLAEEERYSLIMETCLNGWEFFIKKLVDRVSSGHLE